MLTLWTAPMGYAGADRLDITRKSGDPVFAPSWNILGPALALRRAAETTAQVNAAYREAYLGEMRQSYARSRARWHALLSMPEATLVCYCARPSHASHCHRLVLAWLLCQLGATYRGERRTHERIAVGIIGGRARQELDAARAYVRGQPAGTIIVHGGAPGIEEAAAQEAEACGLQHLCLPLTKRLVARHGALSAQHLRDVWISSASDCLAIFPDPGKEEEARAVWGGSLVEML